MKIELTTVIDPEVEGDARTLVTIDEGDLRIEKDGSYIRLSHYEFGKLQEAHLKYLYAIDAVKS